VTCLFSSQQFSSLHVIFGAYVPSVCPGFGSVASSSRSQVAVYAASAAACLTWERPSVTVRWRPPLLVAIVTQVRDRFVASFSDCR